MQLYPENIESKLGLDKIKDQIVSACNCQLGKNLVKSMRLSDDFNTVKEQLIQVVEQKKQIQSGDPFPELQALELRSELEKSAIIGYFLSEEVLFGLKLNLDLADQITRYYVKNHADYPNWGSRAKQASVPKELRVRLDRVFDKRGEVKDNASPGLKNIRNTIRSKEARARKQLDAVLKNATEKGYTDKDSALTIRDGRLVVPLQAEHKRRIKGLVVDESTTGKTVYLEPIQVFEQNNEIRELRFAENREIISILTELTVQVSLMKSDLLIIEQFLGDVDFTRAKARLAIRINACLPEFADKSSIRLVNAYHPILLGAHKQDDAPVIPLNIELDNDQRVVVISGPNAGGKSVALKTVGLLQLMIQSGLLVPVDEASSLGCFKEIFVDIGDQQSIESDLSTYSSHLKSMKLLLSGSTENSLFLIDEFGTGTEPQFGGAIAEAILEALIKKKARGLVTTHYGNLKKFADETPHVANASMRFDLERLVPLYVLELGKPGSSYALEIASKIGLPDGIIVGAQNKVGHDQVAFEKLVGELENEKQQYEQQLQRNQELQASLEEDLKKYQSQLSELKRRERDIIEDAKLEAQSLLAEANQKIENTIRAIKENKAQKAVTVKARKELDDFKKKYRPKKKYTKQKVTIIPGTIAPGDLVRVVGSEAQGEVLSISKGSAQILIGALKSTVKIDRLLKIGKVAKASTPRKGKSNIELHSKRAHFNQQLDIRGLRAHEAIQAVSDFIDEAILLGMNSVSILHGKGDGILRTVVRKHLQSESSIQAIQDEHVERGGSGITLVTLK